VPKDAKELIYLEIERSRINREKAKTVLDKSFMLYFAFLVVGIVGFISGYLDTQMLAIVVWIGIFILVVGTLPYVLISHREDQFLKQKIEEYK